MPEYSIYTSDQVKLIPSRGCQILFQKFGVVAMTLVATWYALKKRVLSHQFGASADTKISDGVTALTLGGAGFLNFESYVKT